MSTLFVILCVQGGRNALHAVTVSTACIDKAMLIVATLLKHGANLSAMDHVRSILLCGVCDAINDL